MAGGGTRPGPEEQRQAGGGARPPKPGSGIGARPRIEAWRAESGLGRTGPERGARGPEPEPSGCGAAARLPRIRAWGRRRGRPEEGGGGGAEKALEAKVGGRDRKWGGGSSGP